MNLDAKAKISFSVDSIEVQIHSVEDATKLLRVLQLFNENRAGLVRVSGPDSNANSGLGPSQLPSKAGPDVSAKPKKQLLSHDDIIQSLREHFKDRVFKSSDAKKYAKRSLGRGSTALMNHMRTEISKKTLFRVSTGRYSFKAPEPRKQVHYEPDQNSLIDVVAPDSKGIIELLKLISSLTVGVNLYFGNNGNNGSSGISDEGGVMTRFSSKDKSVLLELRIGKSFFSKYHVKDHVLLGFICSDLAKIRIDDSLPFHLATMERKDAFFKAGLLGHEQQYKVLTMQTSESGFDIENELPIADVEAEASIPRATLANILSEISAIDSRFKMSFSPEKVLVENAGSTEYARYSKEITPSTAAGGKGTTLACTEPCEGTFDVKSVKEIINSKAMQVVQDLKIKYVSGALVIEASKGPHVRLRFCFIV